VKLCIFDLDGTLLYTLDSIARPTNLVLEHFGLPPQPVGAYKYFVGDGLKNEMKRALIAAGDKEACHLEEAFALCEQWFAEDPMYKVEPYPGIPETLQALKTKGVKLAVFSNKPHESAVRVVESFFGEGMFDCIQGQTDRLPIKPDPAGAFEILKKLGVTADACLYLGDSNTDMMTGRNAGFMTVGAAWGYRSVRELKEAGADLIIDSPDELLGII
jgi:phosphoglycolate phosphatase